MTFLPRIRAFAFLPSRAAVVGVVLTAIVAFVLCGTSPAGAAAPAPFPMPLDSGTRYVEQAATAREELAARAQPEIDRTEQLQRRLQARLDDLNAQVAALEVREMEAAAEIERARVRIGTVAAEQYVHSGGERVNAALDAAMNADDLLSLSRNLHILEKSGSHELEMFASLNAQHAAIVRQLADVTEQRDGAKREVEEAERQLRELRASLEGARQALAEAQDGIARFHRAATTAASPIMGPILLSAGDLAAFVRANGRTPNITVSLDELARAYIEEGAKVGVRGDVAFAQSIVETGWFGFERSMVDPENNNFAGIGACDTCKQGFSFPTARLGVRAQVQLLRVYVDRQVMANSLPDPLLLPGTLRLGFRGRVQSWWDLTGRWATAPNYGNVVYGVYNRMVAASGGR